jgi:mannitol/fructose-specific phosphotransferase system IIA component (Ntr-type)
VRAASIAVLRTAAPVPWNSGGEPVLLAILIAVPEGGRDDDHLKIIARLARRLVHEEFRAGLMSAQDPEAVIRLLERETAV